MALTRLYTVETRNFTFQICCMNKDGFKRLFKQSWKNHCKSYQIEFDSDFFNELVSDYQDNYIEIMEGFCYRDGELI